MVSPGAAGPGAAKGPAKCRRRSICTGGLTERGGQNCRACGTAGWHSGVRDRNRVASTTAAHLAATWPGTGKAAAGRLSGYCPSSRRAVVKTKAGQPPTGSAGIPAQPLLSRRQRTM